MAHRARRWPTGNTGSAITGYLDISWTGHVSREVGPATKRTSRAFRTEVLTYAAPLTCWKNRSWPRRPVAGDRGESTSAAQRIRVRTATWPKCAHDRRRFARRRTDRRRPTRHEPGGCRSERRHHSYQAAGQCGDGRPGNQAARSTGPPSHLVERRFTGRFHLWRPRGMAITAMLARCFEAEVPPRPTQPDPRTLIGKKGS